ncbi:hypothetical protein C0995_015766 [Termitomyces sp. Mi166|nr:hypothetical protein C0995_015766 [Termitomyces sp. Mi166\
MSSQVIVPKPHPVPATETYREKAARKFKENPWVPLGSLATVGALVVAMVKMRRGQSKSFNQWLRVRVAAQGLTVVAICAGTWSSMRSKDKASAAVDGERKEFEERLRGAEQAHEAEAALKKGPTSGNGGWSAWMPWGRSGTTTTDDTKPKS